MSTYMKNEKSRKMIFIAAVAAAGLLIFVFNVLTPWMTDDMSYAATVSQARNFMDLFRQEREQYINWTGRSVNHMILRCFFYFGSTMAFKVANSLVFILLTLLIYKNVEGRKKHDVFAYVLINLLLWKFGVMFSQTVLWQTGACNYLWGSAIIMLHITIYRGLLERNGTENTRLWCPVIFLTGLLAGWCNENTSGGAILLALIWTGIYFYRKKKIRPFMAVGLAGQITGFLFMILAPGNAVRAQFMEEEHTGLLALAGRFQKIILALQRHFLPLLAVFILCAIVICLQQGGLKGVLKKSRNFLLWGFIFLATCFALVLTAEPMARAYFGAGVFLTVAVVQGIMDVSEREVVFRAAKLGFVSLLGMIMFFTYMESGANLARIYREYHERDAYLAQKAAEGAQEVIVPMLRPGFETEYSDGYSSDIGEEPGYWVNVAYEQYYGIESIRGVPREEWTEY